MLFPFKLVRRVASLVLLAVVLYFGITFVQVWSVAADDEARRVDAIVVFGAAQYDGRPSPVLRARLDHAADLYEDGLADTVFVTGGRQPGDSSNEATASADYLSVERGVPQSAILRETDGRNSWQSLASAANELKKRDMIQVLLVSDPFHSARIEAMADELGLEAWVSPTRTSPIGGQEEMGHLVRETVAVGVGRIIGFRTLMGIEKTADRVRDEVGVG